MGGETQMTDEAEGTPRWVKVSAIIAVVAVVLVIIAVATGLGAHGPGRHAPSGDGGTPPTAVPEGHIPPSGIDHDAQVR
jgi:hypothetical protein